MATLRAAFLAALEGDSTFATPLTGGIYDASELAQEGITPTNAPGAWDSTGALKPCALVRWRADLPYGPHFTSERITVEVYVYQEDGVGTIETAVKRLKALLHRTQLTATDYGVRWVNWIGGGGEFSAPELGNATGVMARFECIRTR